MSIDREIMVVKRDVLFSQRSFYDFVEPGEFDFETMILSNYEWMEQRIAESNHSFKQPIGYAIICNPLAKKVFVYQRSSKDEHYAEKKLQGKYSCGVGGHIEKLDMAATNPISASTLREIAEEVDITTSGNLKIIGYINDDLDDVGKVHFGILYLLETNMEIIKPKDPEIKNGRLIHLNELEQICNNPNYPVESWTRIAKAPLKKYLSDNEEFCL